VSQITEPPITTKVTHGVVEPPMRRWRVLAVVAAVILIGTAVATTIHWNRSTTPAQFADFARKLNTVSAPAGSFDNYNPAFAETGTVSAPADSWSLVGNEVWASTEDPHWWVAVRGWEKTVTTSQWADACRDILGWLATSGRELGLTAQAGTETASRCMKALASVQSRDATIIDTWASRGTQMGDGLPRYRTGVQAITEPRTGEVTLRVTAEASVSNP
jgi:hypothetical protein